MWSRLSRFSQNPRVGPAAWQSHGARVRERPLGGRGRRVDEVMRNNKLHNKSAPLSLPRGIKAWGRNFSDPIPCGGGPSLQCQQMAVEPRRNRYQGHVRPATPPARRSSCTTSRHLIQFSLIADLPFFFLRFWRQDTWFSRFTEVLKYSRCTLIKIGRGRSRSSGDF